jgi:hypothetical protein
MVLQEELDMRNGAPFDKLRVRRKGARAQGRKGVTAQGHNGARAQRCKGATVQGRPAFAEASAGKAGNRHQATSNQQLATSNKQPATSNQQQATSN